MSLVVTLNLCLPRGVSCLQLSCCMVDLVQVQRFVGFVQGNFVFHFEQELLPLFGNLLNSLRTMPFFAGKMGTNICPTRLPFLMALSIYGLMWAFRNLFALLYDSSLALISSCPKMHGPLTGIFSCGKQRTER